MDAICSPLPAASTVTSMVRNCIIGLHLNILSIYCYQLHLVAIKMVSNQCLGFLIINKIRHIYFLHMLEHLQLIIKTSIYFEVAFI